jgi:hypothetical protein
VIQIAYQNDEAFVIFTIPHFPFMMMMMMMMTVTVYIITFYFVQVKKQ